MYMEEFKEKIVLISGGLGDIALAIAEAYMKCGAIVALSDRCKRDIAEEKLSHLVQYESQLDYQTVDVSDPYAVENWVNIIRNKYGHIDISIVNAAQVTLKKYQDLSYEEWQAEQRVNLDGAFFFANASAKCFLNDEILGQIIFLGSWAGHAGHANLPTYSVTKAAVRMLCQTMALEYAPFGIRINEIAPGYVNAGLSKVVWEKFPDKKHEVKNTVPLKGVIEVMDVANQVLWVTSKHNKHMTGACVLMDGGLSLIRP